MQRIFFLTFHGSPLVEGPHDKHAHQVNQEPLHGLEPSDTQFVTTSRGSSPRAMQQGLISDSPPAFVQVMTKPLLESVLSSSSPQRHW
jgi:hypothetical protein